MHAELQLNRHLYFFHLEKYAQERDVPSRKFLLKNGWRAGGEEFQTVVLLLKTRHR